MKSLRLCVLALLSASLLTLALGCARNRTARNSKDLGPAGVAYTQQVRVNGLEQSISIRAAQPNLPVVLWLDGTPGGAEAALVTEYLPTLPKSFTLVCWEQRGSGRSAMELMKTAKVEDYVNDTIALSEMLNKRYQQRIYLVGRAWGSVIGLKAVDRRPDLYMGFVSVAQRVNTTETDRAAYQIVLDGTARWGDSLRNKELRNNGEPPYAVGDLGKYPLLFRLIPQYSPRIYDMRVIDPRKDVSVSSSFAERTQLGLDYVYPQLRNLDFEQQVTSVKVPCFFVVGMWDFQTPARITERYYHKLNAPDKDLVCFDKSNNFACYQEPARFVDYMVNTVVPRSKAVATAGTTLPAK